MKTPRVAVKNHYYRPFLTAKKGDVGHDLYVHVDNLGPVEQLVSKIVGTPCAIVWPFFTRTVGSGIFLAMHSTMWAKIEARSSTMRKMMMVLGGIIDSGYQGELFTVLANFGLLPRIVKHGERYAQVIFFKAVRPEMTEDYFDGDEMMRFGATERGATGFGSSGK